MSIVPLVANYPHQSTPSTIAHQLEELGDIPAARVLQYPTPGSATLEDLLQVNESKKNLCELIDGTLVEKTMGIKQSLVAMTIGRILGNFISTKQIGFVTGSDGFFRLPSSVRGPDVAFVKSERFASMKSIENYPAIAPNLVVEVLSDGNTRGEMNRKRLEYFLAGVELVWIVDIVNRTIAIYRSNASYRVISENDTIDGEDVLVGFQCKVAEFFADLDLLESSESMQQR
jgi:Uma2 family endonuclease